MKSTDIRVYILAKKVKQQKKEILVSVINEVVALGAESNRKSNLVPKAILKIGKLPIDQANHKS